MKAFGGLLFGAASLGVTLLAGSPALAAQDDVQGLAACGNIDVEASARCEAQVGIECEANCTPPKVQLACAAELYAECDGRCQVELPNCEVDCQGGCEADCNVNPGNFSCTAECEGSCDASCEGECSARGGDGEAQARCRASCRATCQGRCDASCRGTPPSADCRASCQASCQGSCSGRANIKCQADCQAGGYVECEGRISGGCRARCSQPEGALFCDTNYVDAGNNLQDCYNALRARFDIQVSARGSAECSNGQCTAEGEASASCSVAEPGRCSPAPSRLGWVAGGLGLGLVLSLRRRAQARTSAK
ncbi:MAG TPA: hypothetical protein VFS43_37365 [Polyangiaceae bacterium]|nr:hypothetical protein [Polyangiaceae bacterium]